MKEKAKQMERTKEFQWGKQWDVVLEPMSDETLGKVKVDVLDIVTEMMLEDLMEQMRALQRAEPWDYTKGCM